MRQKFKGQFQVRGLIPALLVLIGLAIVCVIVGSLIWQSVTGGNLKSTDSLRGLQFLQSLGLFVVPSLLYAWFCSSSASDFLSLKFSFSWKLLPFVVVLMLLAIPGINLLAYLNQQMVLPEALRPLELWMKESEGQASQVTERLLSVRTGWQLVTNIFLFALVPAMGEELFFRGALQRIFSNRFGGVAAIWLSAFVFSAIHMQFYGFVPRMLLGAMFGYMLVWTGSLWISVFAHFINNALVVLFFYLKFNGYQWPDIDNIGIGSSLWLGLLSIVCVGVVLLLAKPQLAKYFRESSRGKID